jgi:hypothetical protein
MISEQRKESGPGPLPEIIILPKPKKLLGEEEKVFVPTTPKSIFLMLFFGVVEEVC